MSVELFWDHAGFPPKDVLDLARGLVPRINELNTIVEERDYEDEAASLILPREARFAAQSKSLAHEFSETRLVVVVGVGGSNLGTMAVQEAVLGKSYDIDHPEKQILYADTVDSDSIDSIVRILQRTKGKVLVNAVSKSGDTTETAANLEVLLSKLSDNLSSAVITTDEGSRFEKLAKSMGLKMLTIPKKIGGRYSVFSSVGLFPLSVMGVNIARLLDGARAMLDNCLNASVEHNPAAIIASLLFLNLKRGISIHDHFIFSNDLESMGKWYRQLMAESIGKEWNNDGTKRVIVGITPTVSIGSTDLHSMAQLYLGGPRDKFFRFVSIAKNRASVRVPLMPGFETIVENIQGIELTDIMEAIRKGVQKAFIKAERPFIEVRLPNKSEYSVGQLLQMEMVEIVLLANLLDVNPFDQPAVEDYKRETREILKARQKEI
ncbi:MAG TPA: hypothetical protein VIH03_05390 [Nitrososphaerales archaeon]